MDAASVSNSPPKDEHTKSLQRAPDCLWRREAPAVPCPPVHGGSEGWILQPYREKRKHCFCTCAEPELPCSRKSSSWTPFGFCWRREALITERQVHQLNSVPELLQKTLQDHTDFQETAPVPSYTLSLLFSSTRKQAVLLSPLKKSAPTEAESSKQFHVTCLLLVRLKGTSSCSVSRGEQSLCLEAAAQILCSIG